MGSMYESTSVIAKITSVLVMRVMCNTFRAFRFYEKSNETERVSPKVSHAEGHACPPTECSEKGKHPTGSK